MTSENRDSRRTMNWVLTLWLAYLCLPAWPMLWRDGWGAWSGGDERLAGRRDHSMALEDLVAIESFSEVENQRARLTALAQQAVTEVRQHSRKDSEVRAYASSWALEAAQAEAASRADEFRGTEQEVLLRTEQLFILGKVGLHQEWLETYLRTLYGHPLDSFGVIWAKPALAKAHALGREEEVWAALRHLSEVPYEFEGRTQLQALLADRAVASVGSDGQP